MSDKQQLLTEEQLDFLAEMVSIGVGNAATALTQLLQCQVEVTIPKVHVAPLIQVPYFLGNPSQPVVCVRMCMVGDVTGDVLFAMPMEDRGTLIRLVEPETPRFGKWSRALQENLELSVVTEVGNIIAGVFFTAINNFCRLNIYHTVPTVAIDMLQALMDEILVKLSRQVETIFIVENEFTIAEHRVRVLLVLLPSIESINVLVNSIGQAEIAYREG